jgi:hypothetical protein
MRSVSMRTLVAMVAAVALAGCSGGSGGGGGGGSAPTITSFTATPSSLPVGGGSVTFAWSVAGATGLSIDQNVGVVTPLTTGSTTVEVSTSTTFTLTATNASGSTTGTAQVTVAAAPTLQTISGTVVDLGGFAAAGDTVMLSSGTFSATTVADSDGGFSVPDVPTAPYTASVLDTDGIDATVYVGLTRADPTLTDYGRYTPTNRSATLEGVVSGGFYSEPAGYSTVVGFASPQLERSFTTAANGTYSEAIFRWLGPSTTTGAVSALQIHAPVAFPTDYPGYGETDDVELQDTQITSGADVSLSAVTVATLSGTVDVPSGYHLTYVIASLQTPSGVLLQLLEDDAPTSTAFSYTTPSISSTSLVVQAGISSDVLGFVSAYAVKTGLSANATGVEVTVPPSASLTLPEDMATDVTLTTAFTWTATLGISDFQVICNGSEGPTFYVFTAASTATIPDLSAQGLPLPASTTCLWNVLYYGPATTVDELALAGGLYQLTLGDYSNGESEQRSFTTSP